jgi:hypothetical protein
MDSNPSPREEGTSMRLLLLLAVLALGGCRNDGGSVGNRQPGRTDPMLSIDEQRALGRERYSYIEDDRLSPKAGVDRPDPTYSRH